MLLLRAISARARVAFGRWILDDPFPQFCSHGRINVTGSGNFRHDRQALVPLCVEVEIAMRSMQFIGEEEMNGEANLLSLRCAESIKRSSASQLQWRNECAFVRERDSKAARRGSDDEQFIDRR